MIFSSKRIKRFVQEGRDYLTKDVYQLYRQTCFETIYIKDVTPQENIRAQEVIMILERNIKTKTPRKTN